MLSIAHEFSTLASANAAFSAIATQAGIAAWWTRTSTVGEAPGQSTELTFDKGDRVAVMNFTTEAVETGRLLRWKGGENANPIWPGTTLTWSIEDLGECRQVRFVHDGFATGGPAFAATVDGWREFLVSLQSHLAGKGGSPS